MARRIVILLAVAAALSLVLVFKPRPEALPEVAGQGATSPVEQPRLVDLGASTCVPCRKMAPILDQLREDFAGQFGVVFIDVWQQPEAGEPYGIRVIPTQIFFDDRDRELFRHEGFYSREQILGKWRELGFDFKAPASAGQTTAG